MLSGNLNFLELSGPLQARTALPFKEKPIWCTIYLQYIPSNISTCFGRIYSPSSGGTTVCIQKLVLIVLFRWLCVVLEHRLSSKKNKYQLLCIYGCTSWWWAIDTSETCRSCLTEYSSSSLCATTSILWMFWPSEHIISNFYDLGCS
jgi:hypothetical protein